MLSAKLEIAIQALDNITKVYYAFLNGEPMASLLLSRDHRRHRHHHHPGRYDSVLVPFGVLVGVHDELKRCYGGLAENVAGLIETILAAKSTLAEVYTTNAINVTSFNPTLGNFLFTAQQVRRLNGSVDKQLNST